jgi:hypothetical protein
MVENCLISNLQNNDISPKACKPVSEDICKSKFMAPSENIILPGDLQQGVCCKCKSDENCKYCYDEKNCLSTSDIEMKTKDKFISTNSLCFSDSEESGDSEDDNSDDDLKEELENKKNERIDYEKEIYNDLKYKENKPTPVDENGNLFRINYWYILVSLIIVVASISLFYIMKNKKNVINP